MSKNLYPILLAPALAAVLGAGSLPAILPTRRRALEPGFDLSRSLFDPGRCRERALRKQACRRRLGALQALAVKGGRA